jgi:hypothetical protein
MWIFPQSSRVADNERSRRRKLHDLVHWNAVPATCTKKLFLEDEPAAVGAGIEQELNETKPAYLTFAIRTHEFNQPKTVAVMERNLASLLQSRPERFTFTGPTEALRVLGYAA